MVRQYSMKSFREEVSKTSSYELDLSNPTVIGIILGAIAGVKFLSGKKSKIIKKITRGNPEGTISKTKGAALGAASGALLANMATKEVPDGRSEGSTVPANRVYRPPANVYGDANYSGRF